MEDPSILAPNQDTSTMAIGNEQNSSLLDFNFVESFEGLESLEHDWRALEEKDGKNTNVFQGFAWCWHWAKYAANGIEADWRLKILTGQQNGRLVLLWPMAIPQDAIMNEARWLGEPLTQYGDVLLADDPANELWLIESWRHLHEDKDIDLLHLRKVRSDAVIYPLLKAQAHKLPGNENAPFIDLDPFNDFAELNATYSSKRRRNRRRQRRRLEELGTLKFEMFSPGPKAGPILATALEFKAAWLRKNGRHNSAFTNEDTINTLQSMMRGEDHSVETLISTMHLGHEIIAIEIGFINRNSYFCHIGAFNPWVQTHSPGNVMVEETIDELISKEFQTYDMMAPADMYKQEWMTSMVEIADHAAPITLRGTTHFGLYLKVLRPGMKALYQKMPATLRRRAAKFI
jgi:CelD/BcsL family acetyltransferase involved in cellulose biosynthesis